VANWQRQSFKCTVVKWKKACAARKVLYDFSDCGEVKVVSTGKAKGADAKAPTTITRPRLRRLMLLHERLTEEFQADPPLSRYLNATSIARELNYERRTIKRDIEILQDEWKFPIEYSHKHHGYFYTREVKKFPTLHITTG